MIALFIPAAPFIVGVLIVLLLVSMVAVSWVQQRRAIANFREIERERGRR